MSPERSAVAPMNLGTPPEVPASTSAAAELDGSEAQGSQVSPDKYAVG